MYLECLFCFRARLLVELRNRLVFSTHYESISKRRVCSPTVPGSPPIKIKKNPRGQPVCRQNVQPSPPRGDTPRYTTKPSNLPSSFLLQLPTPLASPLPSPNLHLGPRGLAVPAAHSTSRRPGPAARTRGLLPPNGTVPCGWSRGRPAPHSAPPVAAAAFDVSHLRPRLPLAPVAEELPRGGFPSGHFLRPEIGLPTAAEMSGGSGDKMLLFGSFTEDETKLFHGQPLKSPSKSVNKTWEQPEIQFGSLNFSVLSLQNASSPLVKGVVLPAKSVDGQNSVITKENTCSNKKEAVGSSFPNGGPVLANGCPPVNVSPNNGALEKVKKEAVVPPAVPVLHPAVTAKTISNEVVKDGIKSNQSEGLDKEKEITENGSPVVKRPIVAAPADEAVTSLNKKVSQNMPLLPHGLRNTGNICFLNATLQALLSCSPFVHLLQDLRNRNIPKVGYPTLSAFVEFISQFHVLDESVVKKNEKAITVAAKPLNPAMFDAVLRNFTPDVPAGTSARPRQEDAQEFLSFAMDRMHDELLKLNGNVSNSKEGMVVSTADDDAWETVGRKNKSAIVRTQSFVPSELSAIFGGQLQSVVKATGNKASATVQPYLLLHLDICPDGVQTLHDALHAFSASESLEGYRTAAGKAGLVAAKKSFKIHSLSKIMILHLKRFSYGNHGSTKVYKPLHFPLQLVLNRELLSSPVSEGRKYELVATITHHGRDPSRGHYTAHAKHANGQWLRFDDDTVTPVGQNEVLHDQAYILFYKQV
ncbi:hypothetical protein HU200_045773 [Digitaria exilis]|uniref:Ubiquitin carboxyl-terminal hydrolase n=1 Tax=Digitaria exilis TaxID=1010633 RepID=A0A835EBE8_9POAL|nr:hypothetical protein HU200_045773 [Digitaria exilis]